MLASYIKNIGKLRLFYLILDSFKFQFPKEHGLVAFWINTLILGIYSSLLFDFELVFLSLAVVFSIAVIFSYLSIKRMVRLRFKSIPLIQILSFSVPLTIILLLRPTFHLFVTVLLLGLFTILWVISAMKTKQQNYNVLGFGIMTLTLHFPIILLSSVELNNSEFVQILAIWWIFAGIANATTVRVGSLRRKISHNTPFIRTLGFIISILPLMYILNLNWFFLLTLFEPVIQNTRQLVNKNVFDPKKDSIKVLGYHLVIAFVLSTAIIMIGIYLQFRN